MTEPLRAVPDLDTLLANPARVRDISPDTALALGAELAERRAALDRLGDLLAARALARLGSDSERETGDKPVTLTSAEAAEWFGYAVRDLLGPDFEEARVRVGPVRPVRFHRKVLARIIERRTMGA